MASKGFNRWIIVVAAIMIQLALGSIYAWGVFKTPIAAEFGVTDTAISLTFTILLATFAGVMIFAGRLQDRIGPKKVTLISSFVIGLGYILSGFVSSIEMLYITYGILVGAGVGIGYVCPIAAGVKWFPDKKGLISGLAVAGFGAGAIALLQVGPWIMSLPGMGWRELFFIFGAVYFALTFVGGMLLKNPPEGYKPKGYKAPEVTHERGHTWQYMLKTKKFWALWIMFCFGATAGLMTIGHIKSFGEMLGLEIALAALVVSVLSVFNALGRVTWGGISDKLGHKTFFLMFGLCGLTMLALNFMNTLPLLLIGGALVGFCFGGNFALFPSMTAEYFGSKNIGFNYALMFTAYGVAGIIGPILGGMAVDLTGSYLWAFIPAGILCFIAAGLTLVLDK